MTPAERESAIVEILELSRRPKLPIVKSYFGKGYAFQAPDGTLYGPEPFPTEQAARDYQDRAAAATEAKHREALEDHTPSVLAARLAHWRWDKAARDYRAGAIDDAAFEAARTTYEEISGVNTRPPQPSKRRNKRNR